ncbi:MlaE family lipid ABC transporter permease subunit [Hyphomicrobiales bacterium 4NK60-0047b]|jgi:phospholipid/cholesterol/gamma-HCH transport system permease protein
MASYDQTEDRQAGYSLFGSKEGATSRPALEWSQEQDGYSLRIFGDWQVRHVRRIAKEIKKLKCGTVGAGPKNLTVDMAGLTGLDTAGAMLILDMNELLKSKGFAPEIVNAREADQILFELISRHPRERGDVEEKSSMVLNLVRDLGETVLSIGRDIIEITAMIGQVTVSLLGLVIRPWRLRFTSLVHHMEHAGLKAVSIISLICFLIGAVIMQQSVEQLRAYSAEYFSIDMLGILALREVGVLLTSIMIAGRSGAAFTAEIGSMKMREEVDAMRALGIDPVETLIVPRVLALVIALPLLTFIGNIMCLAGGAFIAYTTMNIDLQSFVERLNDGVDIRHFYVGLIKTPFVALIIGIVGTLEGMRVQGSAESLGTHVRASVVKSIFLVIILDAAFAMALTAMGI